jgi:hypothetical protein
MRSIRPSQAYFKLCLDGDLACSSFINHHDFGMESGLEMTVQIKRVQIARISALTIRNMFRGVGELVCAEYVAQRCKVPLRRAKQIVETLVSEGYLEFDKRYKEMANPYTPARRRRDTAIFPITS